MAFSWSGLGDILATPFTAPTVGVMNAVKGLTGQSAQDANDANQASADKAFAESQGSADKQMAFQERMSNTSYQRAMADMKNSGLNPMLAFSQGGAATPSGSSASGVAATNEDVGKAAIGNMTALAKGGGDLATLPSALSQMKAQTAQSSAQAAQTEAITPAQVKNTESQANLNNATAAEKMQNIKESKTRIPVNQMNEQKIAEEIRNVMKEGNLKDIDVETKARINEFIRQHPHLFKAGQVLQHLNPLKGIFK